MKKLILIAIAFISLNAIAQDKDKKHDRKARAEQMKNMSAEDQATIATKKLTLKLDLTEKQQTQVKELMLEQAIHRKEKMAERAKMKNAKENDSKIKVEKTDDQKIKAINERLDRQIETKQKMKAILTSEQYEKWEKTQSRRQGKSKSKRKMKADH